MSMKSIEPGLSSVESHLNQVHDKPLPSQIMSSSNNKSEPPQLQNDGIFSVIFSTFKKTIVIGTIYFFGYMGWSFGWLVAPIVLAVMRDQWRENASRKREIAKASALANEKDVILARMQDLPAWVYFPDVEKSEWLNKIFQQVWPNANHFAKDLVKNVIEPNVAQALERYKLKGFKFDRIILGTIPPRIGGIKVYDKNISRNEIIMDIDLFYAGNCDINFQLAGMRGGVKDFQIHGIIRVVMKPLISKIPLVGGLQIFFLNNPEIDFNFVGVVDLLDIPGISDVLRKIIIEQIAAIMVLPNKLPITLNDSVSAISVKMPEPEGVIRIHVIEAKDLMKKDRSVLGKGKSDPYAIITVGAQEFRTHIIDNTVDPKWDYWCETVILAEYGQNVLIKLMDKDDTSDDEMLGSTTVEISNIVKQGILDTWITLEHAKHGMVHLRLTWLTLTTLIDDLAAALLETQQLRVTSMSTAILIVFIDSASNLPEARSQCKPDPYSVLRVGKQVEQTTVQMRTDAPVWEQGFTFLVSNPANDVLQLKIIDRKTEKEIGGLIYNLSGLLEKNDLQIASQPFQLQKSGAESAINVSLALRILKNTKSVENHTASQQNNYTQHNFISPDSNNFTSAPQSTPPLRKQTSKVSTNSAMNDNASDSGMADEQYMSSNISIESSTPSTVAQSLPPLEPMPSQPLMPADENEGIGHLIHRTVGTTASSGAAGLGRIQLTLRYSTQRQRLIVIVHKIMNIPLKDPSNIPDPYVKLYLLPTRSKESKRKTVVIKDTCNPVYDATFEYVISAAELMTTELEITVSTQKGFLSSGRPTIGLVKLPLNDPEISQQGFTSWYDLLPESEYDE